MIKIDVFIQEKKWKKHIADPQRYLKTRTKKINNLIPLFKDKKVVFSLLLTGNTKIKKLNKQFRNKNKTTDVLSFPFYKKEEFKKKIENDFKKQKIEEIIAKFLTEKGLKLSNIIQYIRAMITGLDVSPRIYDIMEILGYQEMKKRIENFING